MSIYFDRTLFNLKHSGTNLGLSSAKNYMEGLGGELKLTSAYGQGTEATLLFKL